MLDHYQANTLAYDASKCINCGLCLAVCPHGVFAANGKAVRVVQAQSCMECGACQVNCPTRAIAVESGVGCAEAMIRAALTGRKEATCGCDGEDAICGEAAPLFSATAVARPSGLRSWLRWLRPPGAGESAPAPGGGSPRHSEC